jgi:mevalonate kinase
MDAPLWFRKGEPPEVLRGLPSLHLVLLPRQSAEATGGIVRAVRERLGEDPGLARTIADMGRLARQCRSAWRAGDLSGLAQGLTAQQGALDRLGVVDDDDRAGIHTALAAGALAAKITGAGRGGSLLALVDEDRAEAVARAWGARALAYAT